MELNKFIFFILFFCLVNFNLSSKSLILIVEDGNSFVNITKICLYKISSKDWIYILKDSLIIEDTFRNMEIKISSEGYFDTTFLIKGNVNKILLKPRGLIIREAVIKMNPHFILNLLKECSRNVVKNYCNVDSTIDYYFEQNYQRHDSLKFNDKFVIEINHKKNFSISQENYQELQHEYIGDVYFEKKKKSPKSRFSDRNEINGYIKVLIKNIKTKKSQLYFMGLERIDNRVCYKILGVIYSYIHEVNATALIYIDSTDKAIIKYNTSDSFKSNRTIKASVNFLKVNNKYILSYDLLSNKSNADSYFYILNTISDADKTKPVKVLSQKSLSLFKR
jgi:hypothetical protein